MLEISHLSCGYPEHPVLEDLSLTAASGSLTVILGPNGCGKSTLLKAIAGLLPYGGNVTVNGLPLKELSSADRAKTLSFLPQNRSVPEITAGKLVLHGRFPYLSYPRYYRPQDQAAAEAAMAQLGISGLAHRQLSSLSGGERQKVYLAMLLAQETPLVLLDEPTAFLDIAHKFEILSVARQLAKAGKTVVMVLHDLELAMEYADTVALLHGGSILFSGTPEALFSGGYLETAFGIRVQKVTLPDGIHYCFLPKK